jgi:HSP90 family molecular chaperone
MEKNMPWNRLNDELQWNDVGGRLLANLARGIYTHEAVLREYVQNAADAYKKLDPPAEDQSIVISPEENDLCIQDVGIGMDESDIRAAKKIAVSTKDQLEEMVGFRGIGIWAGFQACERLVVDSTKLGDSRRYRLTIEFEDIFKHVDDNINIKELVDPRYRIECYNDKIDSNEHS